MADPRLRLSVIRAAWPPPATPAEQVAARTRFLDATASRPMMARSRFGLAAALVAVFAVVVTVTTVGRGDEAWAGERVVELGRENAILTTAKDAVVRLDEVSRHGGRLRVQQGRVKLKVTHHVDTAWSVEAGPYVVAVTGTTFALAWDKASATLEVVMEEGEVSVTGPLLEESQRVRAGARLKVSQGRVLELARVDVPPTGPAAEASSSVSVSPEATSAATPTTAEAPTLSVVAPRRGWGALADEGLFLEAYALAQRRGFTALVRETPRQRMLLLADVARAAHAVDDERLVLSTLRSRFAGSAEATTAAFFLGRLSTQRADAARWFGSCFSEAPAGPLAADCLARQLESISGVDDEAARAAATRYLELFPAGAAVNDARRVLRGKGL